MSADEEGSNSDGPFIELKKARLSTEKNERVSQKKTLKALARLKASTTNE